MGRAIKAGSAAGGKTVLVVDDEADLRFFAAYLFEEMGFEVIEAATGVEALATLEQRPDTTLLFTDCRMPEMNGPELARTASGRWPELRIVLVTGFQDRLMPEWPMVWKPYSARTIERVVQRVLAPCLDDLDASPEQPARWTAHVAEESRHRGEGRGEPHWLVGQGSD